MRKVKPKYKQRKVLLHIKVTESIRKIKIQNTFRKVQSLQDKELKEDKKENQKIFIGLLVLLSMEIILVVIYEHIFVSITLYFIIITNQNFINNIIHLSYNLENNS